MGKRQTEWARRKSQELRAILGGKCRKCKVKKKRALHFDVIKPQGNEHHRKMSWDQRVRFYIKQHTEGNLELRCDRCNGEKGATKDKAYYARLRYEQEIEAEGKALASMVITDEDVPF